MARPIWKGHITFGLVNIPIVLYSAERRSDLSFQLLDSRDNKRVRYHRVNEDTGEEVPWDFIVKGYEYDDDNFVLIEKDELEKFRIENQQTIEIAEFVEQCEIDDMYFDKPYFVVPGKKGIKGYALLRRALSDTKTVGIAQVVIRTRQYLAALEPRGEALILTLMRYDQELRSLDEYDFPADELKDADIKDRELKMAQQLVESMKSEWNPKQYHDEYRAKLTEWIESKIKKGDAAEVPHVEEKEDEGAEIMDMMELLKQSVEKKQKPAAKKKAPAKKKAKPAERKRKAG